MISIPKTNIDLIPAYLLEIERLSAETASARQTYLEIQKENRTRTENIRKSLHTAYHFPKQEVSAEMLELG